MVVLRLLRVVRPQTREGKSILWEELPMYHHSSGHPWCVGGDCNAIAAPWERMGMQHPAWEMEDFTNFIEAAALIDAGIAHAKFIWSNMRTNGGEGEIRRVVLRSAYSCISDGGLHHTLASQIWAPRSLLKVKLHIWRNSHGILPTCDKIAYYLQDLPTVCRLCGE